MFSWLMKPRGMKLEKKSKDEKGREREDSAWKTLGKLFVYGNSIEFHSELRSSWGL